ncbi:MAG: helix-turn-helix domain-containing protein, partial [Pseudomonadota bacterium]|nr:helix-turn-helix domain-containing protein [Pseudomonadota bacterium]
PTVGEQLRAARESKKLSLEDIATSTRIPRRHLESLESGDWSRLPAPTYSVGFAKSYAGTVGLDRAAIGEQLRAEMGGHRTDTRSPEVFQPADPARTMPKWLVFAAIAAVILIALLFSWFQDRSLTGPDDVPVAQAPPATAPSPAPAQQPQAAANGPVVLTATESSWIQVSDGGRTLFQGELAPGQPYQVPATATAPMLRAGKPEALRVTVGGRVTPPVGPPGQVAANVSLLGRDLMQSGAAAAAPAPPGPGRQ